MPPPYDDVTLVICTRERPDMLRAALGSFTAATPDAVQILVVDSASTSDETRSVAAEAGADYVRSDIKGLSIARNLGLATSRRDIVVFTDDDCQSLPGWLDEALPHFDDPKVGAVTGRMLDHTLLADAPELAARRHRRTIEGLDAGHGAVMAFRRELVVRLGGFDPILGAGRHLGGAEDLDIFCRILDAGKDIVFEPRCVVHHMNTREDAAYAALHRGYGRGLGALADKWLRLKPAIGARMLAVVGKRTIVRAWGHRANARRRRADLALLGGVCSGLFAAARTPLRGRVFVDVAPPAAITLGVSSEQSGGES